MTRLRATKIHNKWAEKNGLSFSGPGALTKAIAASKHLKNIFADGELDEKVVVSKMETTTPHGAMVGKEQTKLMESIAEYKT